jgi:hypothetical protein
MNQKIKEVLYPGIELMHEYDFGSTTRLLIKSVGNYEGVKNDRNIEILARNEKPEILCDECGKFPAVEICTECSWNGEGWLCKSCVENHECSEEMFLPVLNSPRTGVCGYTGE